MSLAETTTQPRKSDDSWKRHLWALLWLLCWATWLPKAIEWWTTFHGIDLFIPFLFCTKFHAAFQFEILGGGNFLNGASTYASRTIFFAWIAFNLWVAPQYGILAGATICFLSWIHVGAIICMHMFLRIGRPRGTFFELINSKAKKE